MISSTIILQELSLYNLVGRMSHKTKSFRDKRKEIAGDEYKIDAAFDCQIMPPSVEFIFHALPTIKKIVPIVDEHYLKMRGQKAEFYTIKIRIENFYQNKGKAIANMNNADLLRTLQQSEAKIFCNCPSFQFQGFNFRLSQLNASIFPTDIPDSKWGTHHDSNGLVCKHIGALLEDFNAHWMPKMTQLLKRKLIEIFS